MIPSSVRILVCIDPVDMRRGFDGLALLAREKMQSDPMSGTLFLFTNRRHNRLKALWWDRNGYCILYKRLNGAVVELPSSSGLGTSVQIDGTALGQLLAGKKKDIKTKTRSPMLH